MSPRFAAGAQMDPRPSAWRAPAKALGVTVAETGDGPPGGEGGRS